MAKPTAGLKRPEWPKKNWKVLKKIDGVISKIRVFENGGA
jgi:hypothetical protein